MREIKFRAWYSQSHGDQCMLFAGDDKGTTHPLDCIRYFVQGQPVTLMQFTGLTDKNGTEIYEGDIISHHGTNLEIKWHAEYCKYLLGTPHGWLTKFKAEMSEVIGNIHENPELLCAKK